MTLAELAVALEMNEGYLSSLENGKRRYNQDILEKAAGIFQIPAAWLLSRKPVPADRDADYSDPYVVASVMADLDPSERRRVGALIKSYKDPN